MSAPLAIGIVFLPWVFSWFTLRSGHSVLSRVVSLSWCGFIVLGAIGSMGQSSSGGYAGSPASDSASGGKAAVEILRTDEQAQRLLGATHRTIHVSVRNNSTRLLDYVQCNATWYDRDGRVVGTGLGNTTNLASGATRVIDVLGMNVEEAARYTVEVQEGFF